MKDRLPVSPKLTPRWLPTANGQFVKDESRWSSFLLSQPWKANFVLTWRFLWKNLQEQVLRPSLLCWRYTENFWSVESETHSVWLTTWLRMTTSPLKMQRLLSNFQLKQIRYSFYFTSQHKLFVTFNLPLGFMGLSGNFMPSVFSNLCYFGVFPPCSFWTSVSSTSLSRMAGTACNACWQL